MSQEDARGLGKTTDFMRAVSILFLVMNVYYFCYPFFHRLGCTNGMADRILLNLQPGHGAVHPFAGDQVLLPDVPPLLRNGGQGTQTDGDVPPAHRLCPHLRAVVLFLKRAAAHFPVGHPACHAAVRLRRHRGLHLPPDRRHVGRPPSGKPADG